MVQNGGWQIKGEYEGWKLLWTVVMLTEVGLLIPEIVR